MKEQAREIDPEFRRLILRSTVVALDVHHQQQLLELKAERK